MPPESGQGTARRRAIDIAKINSYVLGIHPRRRWGSECPKFPQSPLTFAVLNRKLENKEPTARCLGHEVWEPQETWKTSNMSSKGATSPMSGILCKDNELK